MASPDLEEEEEEEECVLTAQGEGRQVDGEVVLLAGQLAAVTLQVVPVAGVLRHPVHLVAAVGAGRHPRRAAL